MKKILFIFVLTFWFNNLFAEDTVRDLKDTAFKECSKEYTGSELGESVAASKNIGKKLYCSCTIKEIPDEIWTEFLVNSHKDEIVNKFINIGKEKGDLCLLEKNYSKYVNDLYKTQINWKIWIFGFFFIIWVILMYSKDDDEKKISKKKKVKNEDELREDRENRIVLIIMSLISGIIGVCLIVIWISGDFANYTFLIIGSCFLLGASRLRNMAEEKK